MPTALRTIDEYKDENTQKVLEKVIARHDTGYLDGAIYVLEPLAKKYPNSDLMQFALANLYAKDERYEDAMKIYFSLSMKQWDPNAAGLRIKYLLDAAKCYKKYIENQGKSVTEVEQKVGEVLFFMTDYKKDNIQ